MALATLQFGKPKGTALDSLKTLDAAMPDNSERMGKLTDAALVTA
jgi:hypothetical protein